MADPRFIEGQPYKAWFFEEDDDHVDCSIATAVIEPPFVIGDQDTAIQTAFDLYGGMKAEVSHILTTANKTLLEIAIHDEDTKHGHTLRTEEAYLGLKDLVGLLNRVENGTYDGITYNLRED